MRFRWNFALHFQRDPKRVTFTEQLTLRSFAFETEAYDLVRTRYPVSWEREELIAWAKDFIENPEQFHRSLVACRIFVPEANLQKQLTCSDEGRPEDQLSLEELASASTQFSQITPTTVLLPCDRSTADFIWRPDGSFSSHDLESAGTYYRLAKLRELRYRSCVSFIQRMKVRELLDFGCGEGNLLKYLRLCNVDARYHGHDIDPRVVAMNTETFGATFATVLPAKLPELVVFLEVLEHLPRTQAEELVRDCLRRGSRVYLTTPNAEFNERVYLKPLPRHPDHVHEYNEVELRDFVERLRNEGFDVESEGMGRAVKGVRPTWVLSASSCLERTPQDESRAP